MPPKTPLRPRFGQVLFNGGPDRAEGVSFEAFETASETGVRFDIDGRFQGRISSVWNNCVGGLLPSERHAVQNALATLVLQHAMPRYVEGLPELPQEASSPLGAIHQLLYDVRSFCDETEFRDAPEQHTASLLALGPGQNGALDARKVLVLMSGGFDSSLSAAILKECGYEVIGLHVRTNRHVESLEEQATKRIANKLSIPLNIICLDFPDQEGVGRYYSRTFGIYPFYNSIPHGRDIPLAAISAVVARHLGCRQVSFGHEKESRRKVIPSHDRAIYRHDVESSHGFSLLRRFIQNSIHPKISLFSPISGLSIYQVRSIMMRKFPDISRDVQTCFWSRCCEKCLKCVSTYSLQREFGISLIPFSNNPFADKDDKDMAVFVKPDRPHEMIGYGPQMVHTMAQIIAGGDVTGDDYWLHRFRDEILERAPDQISRMRQICLDIDSPEEVPADVLWLISELVKNG